MTDRDSFFTVERAECLVGPVRCSENEYTFWTRYEPLIRAFEEDGNVLGEEECFGLHVLGQWLIEASEEEERQSGALWGASLLKVEGSALVADLLEGGLMPGFDAARVIGAIVDFLRWTREREGGRNDVASHLLNELERSRPQYLAKLAEPAPDYATQDARDRASASWVAALDAAGRSLDVRLLGQSLCHDALEQLESTRLEDALWESLDLRALLQHTSRQLPLLDLRRKDLKALARLFVSFLVGSKYISHQLATRFMRTLARWR